MQVEDRHGHGHVHGHAMALPIVRINTILRFHHVMPIRADHFENPLTCPTIVEVMILTNQLRRTPLYHTVCVDVGTSYVGERR